ncbi:MAG: hypothetical protein WCO16_02000 [bacterium]
MTEDNQKHEQIHVPEPVTEQLEHPSDSDQSLFMGLLCYLNILVIIPLLTSKKNPFVKFHIKQGLVLVICEAVLWVAMKMFWPLMPIIGLLQLVIFVLAVIGIVNVVQKKQKELPIVGKFARTIKI